MAMMIIIGYAIAFIAVFVAALISINKSKKNKLKVWGIALMAPISPALAFAIGRHYAVIVENGWPH